MLHVPWLTMQFLCQFASDLGIIKIKKALNSISKYWLFTKQLRHLSLLTLISLLYLSFVLLKFENPNNYCYWLLINQILSAKIIIWIVLSHVTLEIREETILYLTSWKINSCVLKFLVCELWYTIFLMDRKM